MFEDLDTATVDEALDGYIVQAELDRGGYGIAFTAYRGGQHLVVKVLDTRWQEAAIRSPLEVEALRSVNHPHVVKIVDSGFLAVAAEPSRYRFIVCEFVPGQNLAALVQAGHRFSASETRSVLSQLADGLVAVHAARLIHRDIKPKNVVFDPAAGRAVLLDLGVAKHMDTTPVTVGSAPGTTGWKSPEHLLRLDLDARSDIYCLGLLGYWMAVNKHPFQDQAIRTDIETAMLAGQFSPIQPQVANFPHDLAVIIESCLSRQPYMRPRSAAALTHMLEAVGT